MCEHVADLALDACAGAHVPQSLVGRVAGVRDLHDCAAAGALAFDDLVHQLPAVPQAVGVAEQPGPARPGSNSAMLNGSVAGSPYSGLQRIGEPLRKLTEPLVAERSHGRLLALPGKPRLGGLAGALRGAGDRGRGGVERGGYFPGRESEHFAEDEGRALPRGQMLQRGDEGQLDRLALFVARLG